MSFKGAMLISKFSEKRLEKMLKANDVIAQIKYDGVRVQYVDGKIFTRTGKEIKFPKGSHMSNYMDAFEHPKRIAVDGEMLVYTERAGFPLPRKTISGILNKAIKGTLTASECDSYHFFIVAFDTITNDEHDPYIKRFDRIVDLDLPSFISSTGYVKVESVAKAKDMFKEIRKSGLEGIVLKSTNNSWQPKRVTDMIKMKEELTVDLKVVAHEDGKGRCEGMLGALVCETADGKIRVSVGTGLTDEDRMNPPPIGSIVEIKYNEVIDSKVNDTLSLFLPVYIQTRNDKTVADNLKDIQ